MTDHPDDYTTKLAGSAFPEEVLEEHPELGSYVFSPSAMRYPEVPGMIQMVVASFIPDKGWLVTKRSIIYGGRHGPPPLIYDDEEKILGIMTHELRSAIRAMKHRFHREA
jgi:hypothetical protein